MKIALKNYDDWQALYFNGVLVWEGHSLDAHTMMSILLREKIFLEEVDFQSLQPTEADSEETYKSGSAPPLLVL